MKILVVSDRYPPDFVGGMELSCEQAVNGQRALGHDVAVICRGEEQAVADYGTVSRCLVTVTARVHSLADKVRFHRNAAITYLENYRIALRLLHQLQPDVVLFCNPSQIGLGPAIAAQELGLPVVFRVGDYSLPKLWGFTTGRRIKSRAFARPLYRLLYGPLIKVGKQLEYRHAFYISEMLQRKIESLGLRAAHSEVVYNAARFAPLSGDELKNPDPFHLLFVGRLVRHKGAHVAIEVLARVRELEPTLPWTLTLVGHGKPDYVAELRALVGRLALDDFVSFAGHVQPSEAHEAFAQHATYLFPSIWHEPFGSVLIEAMGHGCVPIAINRGAVPEIVRHGEEGFVTEASAEAMARAALELVSDHERLSRMRRACLSAVTDRFAETAQRNAIQTFLADAVEA